MRANAPASLENARFLVITLDNPPAESFGIDFLVPERAIAEFDVYLDCNEEVLETAGLGPDCELALYRSEDGYVSYLAHDAKSWFQGSLEEIGWPEYDGLSTDNQEKEPMIDSNAAESEEDQSEAGEAAESEETGQAEEGEAAEAEVTGQSEGSEAAESGNAAEAGNIVSWFIRSYEPGYDLLCSMNEDVRLVIFDRQGRILSISEGVPVSYNTYSEHYGKIEYDVESDLISSSAENIGFEQHYPDQNGGSGDTDSSNSSGGGGRFFQVIGAFLYGLFGLVLIFILLMVFTMLVEFIVALFFKLSPAAVVLGVNFV